MPPPNCNEKRRAPRRTLDTRCPMKFAIDGEVHSADLVDLSWRGARFTETETRGKSIAQANDVMEVMITTSVGTGPCFGRVAWVDQIDGHPEWGFEFLCTRAELEALFALDLR